MFGGFKGNYRTKTDYGKIPYPEKLPSFIHKELYDFDVMKDMNIL